LFAFIATIAAFLVTSSNFAANQGSLAPASRQVAAVPPTYRLPGAERRPYTYDAKAEIDGYVQLVHDSYASALNIAQAMKAAIDDFLAKPDDNTLARARDAWTIARRDWEQTEAFRFYDGPIDVSDAAIGPHQRLDGWPVDPAAIDYVADNPTSGIVNDMQAPLTRATLLARQTQSGTGRAVTTGWHAIEFLLWGEQTNAPGEPGDRPVTDFLAGQPNNDRRRAYLKLASDMLIEDLRHLVDSWDPKNRTLYADRFHLLNQREALGRIMNGIALLASQELATNRLATALDTGSRNTLTSPFSETSYQDFVFALRGLRNVWTGDAGGETRAGLGGLVGRVDAALGQRILHALDHAEESIGALYTPLDRETLPAPADSAARREAERAIADLKRLAALIRDAGIKLGVQVFLPS
jgi:putative iron-regulated protein